MVHCSLGRDFLCFVDHADGARPLRRGDGGTAELERGGQRRGKENKTEELHHAL